MHRTTPSPPTPRSSPTSAPFSRNAWPKRCAADAIHQLIYSFNNVNNINHIWSSAMNLNRKRLYSALAAELVIAGAGSTALLYGHGSRVSAAEAPPAAAEVDAAYVVATITDFQSYSGRIEAIDKVDIRPLVPGTIVAVHFKDGSFVKKGDPLFTIDPRPYAAEVDRASAQLAAAQARNGYSATDAARAERLLADNAIAKRDYDQTQNAAHEALANLKAAQAALETAKINLTYTQIVAPVAGRVSRAELTLGNIVSTGAS